jgi:hypothetical protein
MVEPMEAAFCSDAAATHRQIIKRFQLLFGRDMTAKERQTFFLPDNDSSLAEEKK